MSQVIRNFMLQGIRGRVGDFVFRQHKGKTILCKYPHMPEKRSRKQATNSQRFREAVAYAREILADPARKALYRKKVKRRQSVYHYAIREYMGRGGRMG